ncbi:MAG TPA: PEP-CTERM sorting domain-containing protein [Bryobacteraceae bacterium]|nr:PEP-CTERM sorting domain-containing protein [Bryobacteraceae bacterium]
MRLNATAGLPAALFLAALSATLPANAATIAIDSSSAVTYLSSGSTTTDFPSTFTTANFAAAMTGTAASVLNSTPFYFPASDIPGAVWIGTNVNAGTSTGDTALYAVSFVLPAVSSASLTIQYGVDNDLGDTRAGIYLNDAALPNSTGNPCGVGVACGSAFTTVQTYTDSSIGSLLVPGTNTLFFDAVNLGAEGGLIFSANITYTAGASVPEPSSFILLGTALSAFVGLWMHKRSARREPPQRAS